MSGRRSKPNRGGGRFNKPRGGGRGGRGRGGGGGGGGNRKAASGGWDDGDDFSLDLGPSQSFKPPSSRGSRGGGVRGARGGTGRGRSLGLPRKYDEEEKRSRFRPEQVQLPLQKIHMTSENKLQVKELLRELQNQEYHTSNR